MTWFSLSILQTLLQTDIFLVLSTTAYSSDVKYKNPLTFLISLIIHNMGEHIITCSYRCMAGYQRIFFFHFYVFHRTHAFQVLQHKLHG
jgi:hypothetical protein